MAPNPITFNRSSSSKSMRNKMEKFMHRLFVLLILASITLACSKDGVICGPDYVYCCPPLQCVGNGVYHCRWPDDYNECSKDGDICGPDYVSCCPPLECVGNNVYHCRWPNDYKQFNVTNV